MSLDIHFSCPHCNHDHTSFNITHNLGNMARAAGLYDALWHPETVGIKTAHDLSEKIVDALRDLESNRNKYVIYNAKNGWGTYEDFVGFVRDVYSAALENPTYVVEVSR